MRGRPGRIPVEEPSLPPLVLRCRPVWRLLFGLGAGVLLVLGTGGLARAGIDPAPSWALTAAPLVCLASGCGCAYFAARYCLARLVLDDRGFSLKGPLGGREVAWAAVVRWERLSGRGGPASLRVVHGPGRRRLTVPLIYEDCHVLEIGLQQRGFPRY